MNEQRTLLANVINFLTQRSYGPEERVPSERDLANRFAVSRGQIREALSVLEGLRVIERRPKSGIYMTDGVASVEALSLFVQVGVPLRHEEVAQIIEVRRIHELEAIRLACERRTDADLASLRDILDRSDRNIRGGESIAVEDRLFHSAIIKATQNDILFRMANIFYLITENRRAFYFQQANRCEQSHREHLNLYEAISARDADRAVQALGAHLQGVDSYWQDIITTPDSGPASANDRLTATR